MTRQADLTGRKFSRWLVLKPASSEDRNDLWMCRCDCGRERAVLGVNLRAIKSRGCGCTRGRTHGMAASGKEAPEYWVWHGMRQRCANPQNANYHLYGGQGIQVCERWTRFEGFYEDMGPRPTPKHSLDRIDRTGNYEPGNVRWATDHEQTRNTRRNIFAEMDGERKVVKDWAIQYGVPYMTLKERIRKGMSLKDALAVPSGNIDRAPSSGYRGVYRHPKRRNPWQVKFEVDGRSKSFGYYETAETAAAVYNREARAVFGDRAYQNPVPD